MYCDLTCEQQHVLPTVCPRIAMPIVLTLQRHCHLQTMRSADTKASICCQLNAASCTAAASPGGALC